MISLNSSPRLRGLATSACKLVSVIRNDQPDLRQFLGPQSRTNTQSGNAQIEPKVRRGVVKSNEILCNCDDDAKLSKCSRSIRCQYRVDQVPFYIRTYGCQMNVNDTSILSAILQDYGYKLVENESEAEIYLIMTCAIRESAEDKIWNRLRQLKKLKQDPKHPLKQVGMLGCMAERLKSKVLETENSVDIVAGPDAYRDLPRLFSINKMSKEKAINCLLSFDETYSDIRPITKVNEVTSFLSITRGCDNLCSYCVVPFTRGRERSRALPTIIDEVKGLVSRGIKEVTLLGQNVNSYRDLATKPETIGRLDLVDLVRGKESPASGFGTVYKPRVRGLTFDVLLEEVAKISTELRIRFTSPHPKDFTDDVIDVMSRYPNIARCIHLPAQSGSDSVLERMRRGYTKEAYLQLVDRLRASMPDLAITSDFITGFCGESEADHEETIDLIKRIRYNFIYVFPYSDRDKTSAHHNLDDNVPHDVKVRRLEEIRDLFRAQATEINQSLIHSSQLVLVEATSRRSEDRWQGRADNNVKTILPRVECLDLKSGYIRQIQPGDYVNCQIETANSQTLYAKPISITTQESFHSELGGCLMNVPKKLQ